MRIFTSSDINSWCSCVSATEKLGPLWIGTAILLLNESTNVPLVQDRLWTVLRTYLLPEAEIRRFGAWCAAQITQTDPRSIAALDMAELLAQGTATESQRFEAENTAWQAVVQSPNAEETAKRTSAARSIYQSASVGALQAAIWAAAHSDPAIKAQREADQIAHAIEVFQAYGL